MSSGLLHLSGCQVLAEFAIWTQLIIMFGGCNISQRWQTARVGRFVVVFFLGFQNSASSIISRLFNKDDRSPEKHSGGCRITWK